MNLNFSVMSKSLSSVATLMNSPAKLAPATTPAASSPAKAAESNSVFHAAENSLAKDLKWSGPAGNSVAERGIIIVGGKDASPAKSAATNDLAKNGIIIVSGKTGRDSLAERGIIFVGGKTSHNSLAERGIIFVGGHTETAARKAPRSVDSIKAAFDGKQKELESQDKLGNFEIQDLMSRYNQNQTLASSVVQKRDDTTSSILGKI